jgi:hypothetical protein
MSNGAGCTVEGVHNPPRRPRLAFIEPCCVCLHGKGEQHHEYSKGEKMHSFGFRTALVGLIAFLGASVSSIAHADEGTIRISVLKGGWFIGASGGHGTLMFHGQRYPLSIGGVSAGLVFGAAETYLSGRVSNIHRPSDVAGVYGAGGAGAAVGRGVGAIVLTNEKGAVLKLTGRQAGLMVNADLSGLAISIP